MHITTTKLQSKPLANIDNIGIVSNEVGSEYFIISEWDIRPVKSYHSITEAIEFVRGFKDLPIAYRSKAYNNGQIMKQCLLYDVNQCETKIYKVNDIENYGCIV